MTGRIAGLSALAAAVLVAAPGAALAHPHVFIDATVDVLYDAAGAAAAVRVGWSHDDLYSLLLVEDLGLDPDGDGVLTDAENATIVAEAATWDPSFAGDLYLLDARGASVPLARPLDFAVDYADGRLVVRHTRPLATPHPGEAPLTIQVYDPSFYADYRIVGRPRLQGRADCVATVFEPDPNAAGAAYEAALAAALEMTPDATAEVMTLDIGAAGADEVRVACGGGT